MSHNRDGMPFSVFFTLAIVMGYAVLMVTGLRPGGSFRWWHWVAFAVLAVPLAINGKEAVKWFSADKRRD